MGLEFLNISGGGIGDVLVAVYKFALGLIGISALVMFVLGAIIFMSAGDSKDRVGEGRKYMTNAVWGLVLALLSWVILYTINPDLVQRLDLNLVGIERAKVPELSPEAQQTLNRLGDQQVRKEVTGGAPIYDAKEFADWVGNREKEQRDRQEFLQNCTRLAGDRAQVRETRRDTGGIMGNTAVKLICIKR